MTVPGSFQSQALAADESLRLVYDSTRQIGLSRPLHLDYGGRIALLGPSGDGKTTLLNLLAALVRPTQGAVRYYPRHDGRDGGSALTWGAEHWRVGELEVARRQFGFIFQDAHLLPRLTCLENILLPARLYGKTNEGKTNSPAEDEIRSWMAAFALTRSEEGAMAGYDVAGLYPHQISGGQRRRVAVLRALANDPAIVFADEPVNGLDGELQGLVMGFLSRWVHERPESRLLIFVSHNPLDALRWSDRCFSFRGGLLRELEADWFRQRMAEHLTPLEMTDAHRARMDAWLA
uniref:Putative ABC transport system ATP-binding protein /polar amino acid transport system ATP-binding protein n=1 Tax=Candidatus Kentrum sp. MB TaxID=2138164 RepID=A0A451B7H8_9GAMM|nr:MAG: putative ABC transport system ATP-binding protein /polar amino acid transport system ATP-binding protein [Candidatus Kentron sp. MB]VFK74177.1 MAG: putative ABC transport system ATP-binding protein /polar amino acid transport system ATP-binding protein [Candidatus Kentron sp. MB]